MKTLPFNILKPLALTALFIVFAAGLNTTEAKSCKSRLDCPGGACDKAPWEKSGKCTSSAGF